MNPLEAAVEQLKNDFSPANFAAAVAAVIAGEPEPVAEGPKALEPELPVEAGQPVEQAPPDPSGVPV